ASPQSKLEVNGDVRLSQGGTGKLIFPDNSVLTTANLGGAASSVTNPTDAVIGADNDANGSGVLLFNTGASTRMYIQNDGAIGVGTTTPGFTMDIQGSLGVRDGATIGGLLSAYSGVAIGGRDGYMVDNAFGN